MEEEKTSHSETPARPGWSGIVLRLFFFFLLEYLGLVVFSTMLDEMFGRLVAGALGTFLAAVLANALTVRIYERGRLEDVGMGWGRDAKRHLFIGLAGGIAAALAVSGALLALGLARLEPSSEMAFGPGKLLFVIVLLAFGAVGEELLFRGYGFQTLITALGPWWMVPLSAVLFSLLHASNPNASPLGLVNTGLWGVVLGYAYWRAGDLWLPIGLHLGWNWVLPLFGANLSGLTMGLSGYVMKARGMEIWSGGEYGPEGSVLTSLATVALTAGLWKVRIGKRQTEA
ncbi:MAG: CPBP family intramembrane metalloprotease [Candidatus Solibacter usitatus]|nr:CPBP family intramembrane metalloprotease [Candidatus Solibacter usitatus]